MSRLRCSARVVGLVLVTSALFSIWLLSRPVSLVSRRLSLRSHQALFRGWARLAAHTIGLRIKVEGVPPEPPFLLVSNHLGYIDVVTLGSLCRTRFLSRADVAHWPVVGFLARRMGTLFIDRARKSQLPRITNEISSVFEGGEGVVLFPEGTSSSGASVLPFRASLFELPARAGLPVSLATISYATPPGAPPAGLSVCWWGEMTFGKHFLELLALPFVEARVSFAPEALRGDDRKRLAEDAWRIISAKLPRSPGLEVATSPS